MPTLRNRSTKPGYCVRWKAHPEHDRPSTYQITSQALRFIRGLGYKAPNKGDEVKLPDGLCRPLRILGDLHFKEEEAAGKVDLTEVPTLSDTYTPELSAEEEGLLKEYIEEHPRLTKEKEGKLGMELSELGDDDSTSLEDLLGKRESNLPPVIQDIVQGWGAEKSQQQIGDIPGFEESIVSFYNHPREVTYLGVHDGMLTFGYEAIVLGSRTWEFSVVDTRGDDSDEYDLFFYFYPKTGQPPEPVTHLISISDGHFTSWRVQIVNEDVTQGVQNVEDVSGPEFHRILLDKVLILDAIEQFIEELDEARLGEPAEWE